MKKLSLFFIIFFSSFENRNQRDSGQEKKENNLIREIRNKNEINRFCVCGDPIRKKKKGKKKKKRGLRKLFQWKEGNKRKKSLRSVR